MIVHEFTGTEEHPIYQALTVDNGNRQYDFLRSIVAAALAMQRPYFSSTIIRALNFHAIACLHPYAGEYRPCEVKVGDDYQPPPAFAVPSLMEDFINQVNHEWRKGDPLVLAAFVLWKLNLIHPFINGNGRTARAACYYVLCLKLGGWLKGEMILPEALRQNHAEYVAAIKAVDASLATGQFSLAPLHGLLQRLLMKQLEIEPDGAAEPEASTPPDNGDAA
ncbi:MAG: Fic family protein [Aestuariivirga sp.]|nr:Fic family protein [Aestuariivirga sp.]